jgi:hypothetical protein
MTSLLFNLTQKIVLHELVLSGWSLGQLRILEREVCAALQQTSLLNSRCVAFRHDAFSFWALGILCTRTTHL